MKLTLVSLASLIAALTLAGCSSPNPAASDPQYMADHSNTPPELANPNILTPSEFDSWRSSKDLLEQAREARRNGDRATARQISRKALNDLLAEGLFGPSDPRIQLLFNYSQLLDQIAENDQDTALAFRGWNRVLECSGPGGVGDDRRASVTNASTAQADSQAVDAPVLREPASEPTAPESSKKSQADSPAGVRHPPIQGSRALHESRLADLIAKGRPMDDADVMEERNILAELYKAEGDYKSAKDQYEALLAAYAAIHAKNQKRLSKDVLDDELRVREEYAEFLFDRGDFSASDELYEQIVESRSGGSSTDPDLNRALMGQTKALDGKAKALESQGDLAGAQEALQAAMLSCQRGQPTDETVLVATENHLAGVIETQQHQLSARADQPSGSGTSEKVDRLFAGSQLLPPHHPVRIRAQEDRADELIRSCQFAKALAVREQAVKALNADPNAEHAVLVEAERELAAILRVMGQTEDARKWEDRLAK